MLMDAKNSEFNFKNAKNLPLALLSNLLGRITPWIYRPELPSIINLSTITREQTQLRGILNRAGESEIHLFIVPSLSFNYQQIKDILGISYYELRTLWHILKSTPRIKVYFISTYPVSQETIDYYFSFHQDQKQAKKNIIFLNLKEHAKEDINNEYSLSENILNSPSFIEKIKDYIVPGASYLSPFMGTSLENKLARQLNIPLYGLHQDLELFNTKTVNRNVFKHCRILYPQGVENLRSDQQIIKALNDMWSSMNEGKVVFKFNEGVSGKGNLFIDFPCRYKQLDIKNKSEIKIILANLLEKIKTEFLSKGISFNEQIKNGAIIEEFIDGESKSSPSVQGNISPAGEVKIFSTHEQILDSSGNVYQGCLFPAHSDYRQNLQQVAKQIGTQLYQYRVIGPFSIDFLAVKKNNQYYCYAIEINVREGGTTHPYQIAKMLTQSVYDISKGILVDQKNRDIYYLSDDNLTAKNLIGKEIKDFLQFVQKSSLHFNPVTNTGAFFHMLGPMKEYGKIGVTIIGNNSSELDKTYQKVVKMIASFE